jgi:hypothetical protein
MRVRSRRPLTLAEQEPITLMTVPGPAAREPEPEPQAEPEAQPVERLAVDSAPEPVEDTPLELRPEPAARSATEAPLQFAPTAAPEPEAVDATPAPLRDVHAKPQRAPFFGLINPYFGAVIASVIWAAGVSAFAVGYQGWKAFDYDLYRLTILAFLSVGPVPILFGAALLMQRSAALAMETRRAYALSQAMTAPTAHAAGKAADLLRTLREEISRATETADRARADLAAIRDSLERQTRDLEATTAQAVQTAGAATGTLGRERERMAEIGEALDRQAASVAAAMDNQFHMVRDAAELAQTQLKEAESALAARAADLAAAAGEAQDAARLASDDLARQTLRLETAGAGVAEQVRSVEEGLSQQRAALVQETYQLRADQEAFSAQVESQRAQMVEILSTARTASSELGEVSSRSAEALNELVQAAAHHFRELAGASEGERAGFEARLREWIEQFSAQAAGARDEMAQATAQAQAALAAAALDARRAADETAEAAKARIDAMGEAAFEAGKRADEAFEARMAASRKLIEEASSVVEAAGQRTAAKIEADVKAMSDAIAQVEGALSQIDGRAARLPDEAKARIDEISKAVETGLNALAEAARKAAHETEVADAAFQDRIKRNYEMLTEAVRLMGVVSGEAPPARRAEAPPEARHEPAPEPESSGSGSSTGLRGRLKLGRGEPDGALRSLFETPAPRPDGEPRSWRDVLGGLDPAARASAEDDDEAAQRLIEEIRRLGVDPQALLPKSRVDEATAAWAKGDADGARQVVRRVAPAAVRRISRKVITDRTLRTLAERYVAVYHAKLGGDAGAGAAGLLASDAGRSFLLIDAAMGELNT